MIIILRLLAIALAAVFPLVASANCPPTDILEVPRRANQYPIMSFVLNNYRGIIVDSLEYGPNFCGLITLVESLQGKNTDSGSEIEEILTNLVFAHSHPYVIAKTLSERYDPLHPKD